MSLRPFVHVDVSLRGAVAEAALPLSPGELHHLSRVLRLRPGAQLEVSDGRGSVADATLRAEGVVLRSAARSLERRAPSLAVAQALPKGRKLEEVVRQVTELGVDTIIPVRAERSVARPSGDRTERVRDRAEAVARAAAEQARSPWRPTVSPLIDTAALPVSEGGPAGETGRELLVAHLGAPGLPCVLAGLGEVTDVVLAIGPEGGWSDREIEQLLAAGGRVVGLGATVLRTEHAAAAAVAVTAAAFGRWNDVTAT